MRSHGEIEAAPDQRGLTTTKTNSVNDQPNLTAALSLAAMGLPVFPAAPDKRPLLVGWQKKASSEPEQIRNWWRAHPDALPAIFVGVPASLSLTAIGTLAAMTASRPSTGF